MGRNKKSLVLRLIKLFYNKAGNFVYLAPSFIFRRSKANIGP